ncbi:sucrase ferredoxin [Saccharopolyspora griseoalba]|uniref:Sucrase ferredoxin n=1 Tax=Saccharopolyspora griseoalba TaxID=1431848 RepID=A0ABW2LIV5_9PSEU
MRSTTAETTCAGLARALGEPLPGTAAVATAWLCLEQRGPWGHNALLQSHLDPDLGRELDRRASAHGVRVQLVRRPGPHADTGGPRQVLLGHSAPGGWLRERTVDDPAELLGLDFARIAAGRHDGWGEPADPVLLVCTNGRRDRCCAVLGRELVERVGEHRREAIWETTHTGGHRFAPAAVLLPTGYTYGRLTSHQVDSALAAAAAGKVSLDGLRGRSAWSRAGQAAEIAVRRELGEDHADALEVGAASETDEHTEVEVHHRDGRCWRVAVRAEELDPPRANSCGKDAVRPFALRARVIRR